ncbi:MAG: bifunctional (p)ppGpp synthetase/guanosine-3',5'-bis(diphosphate) 3'-pyrophosphohydrolase [Myxococcales bacterium]|nr:bifunctional (p)ppGpp synthetase/guanosine-3',5'-bis(diphosphate) 3'-pyrophosphohydrolase [Myxococcales bacterium]
MFSPEFEVALTFAAHRHAGQTRKGTGAAYLTHLVHVARIVRGYGYDIDHEITALLHDVLEDTCADQAERHAVTAELEAAFGSRVAQAVEALSEPRFDAAGGRLSWLDRKQAYIEHLEHASALAVRVSAADKIHNLATLMTDLDAKGPHIWSRFRGSPEQSAWFYRAVAKHVAHRIPREPIAAELSRLSAALDAQVEASA